ncbi:MAG: tetratricopeptide repeat protein [Hyphomicrobiaceae bacterium]
MATGVLNMRASARSLTLAVTCLGLAACAQGSGGAGSLLAQSAPAAKPAEAPGGQPKSELQRAIEYWGGEFQKKPQDPKVALSFARNLKAGGHSAHAMQVLAQAHTLHQADREIASEYGRLALAADKIAMADSLLAFADDPTKPDWRVVSARGTVMAKRGEYARAIGFYERAMALAPGEASVLNNLALAYAANGESQRAEALLRTASARAQGSSKIRQNLALVVGLQGRYGEAEALASKDLPPDQAAANARFVRQLVRLPEKSAPAAPAVAFGGDGKPPVLRASVPAGKPSKAMLAVQKLADAETSSRR